MSTIQSVQEDAGHALKTPYLSVSTSSTSESLPLTLSDYQRAFATTSPFCLNGQIERPGLHPLASGGFADVWKGTFGSLPVAIKVMRPFGSTGGRVHQNKLFKRLWREFLGWSSLSHQNILQCLGFSYDFSWDSNVTVPALISPWMSNGTLLSYLESHPDIPNRLGLLLGIAEGLSYLHSREPPIVHGDLRAGNVLVSDSGTPYLSDFGLSKILTETRGMTTSTEVAGSLRWMSPELIHGNSASIASDVWAYGMTVLEIMSGRRPYNEIKYDAAVFGLILKGQLPARPNDQTLNQSIWDICCRCWGQSSKNRPSMHAVTSMVTVESGPKDKDEQRSSMSPQSRRLLPPTQGGTSMSHVTLPDLPSGSQQLQPQPQSQSRPQQIATQAPNDIQMSPQSCDPLQSTQGGTSMGHVTPPSSQHIGPYARPTLQQMNAAMQSIRLAEEDFCNKRRAYPLVVVSDHEKASYVQTFAQLWRFVQEAEKKLIMYHALFEDEASMRKLVAIIVATKEQRKLLANPTAPPQYILRLQIVLSIFLELSSMMDPFYKALATMAPQGMETPLKKGVSTPPQGSLTSLAGTAPGNHTGRERKRERLDDSVTQGGNTPDRSNRDHSPKRFRQVDWDELPNEKKGK